VIDVDEGNESEIEIDVDENENDGNDEGNESDGNAIVGIRNDNNEIWIEMGEIEVDESLSEILSDYEID
jgi:hypothetical protein